MIEKKKILITGGGTGGHVMPALAIYDYMNKQGNSEFLYVGGSRGLENILVTKEKIEYKKIWISGFHRGDMMKNILFPIKVIVSLFQSFWILIKFRPDIVVGTGGYVTGPIVYAASILSFPTIIVEQDIHPGITTRLLSRFVNKVCLAFEKSISNLGRLPENKIIVTGNPVRPAIQPVEKKQACGEFGLNVEKKTIFVFGGSQGAHFINSALIKILDDFKKLDIQLLWQTGENEFQEAKEKLTQSSITGAVFPFIDNMAAAYSAADIVIGRAGAISLAEIGTMRIPAILIPYPFAAGNHQKINAEMVQEAGAAIMITEDIPAFEVKLLSELTTLLDDNQLLHKMAENWKNIYRSDSLKLIEEQITLLYK